MQFKKLVLISLLSLALVPSTAAAQDWFFTPFIGANFGGDMNGDFGDTEDEAERRLDFGATLGWSPGAVGFEIDFGYSPNFFQPTLGAGDFEVGDSNLTTLMANVLVGGGPGSGIRPYGSAGLGLIRANVSDADGFFDDLSTNDLGINLGGGVQGQFSDNVGLRGDIRYFRSLQNAEPDNDFDFDFGDLDFWRGTVGVTFRW
jgi:opacity protein-like surface antigen